MEAALRAWESTQLSDLKGKFGSAAVRFILSRFSAVFLARNARPSLQTSAENCPAHARHVATANAQVRMASAAGGGGSGDDGNSSDDSVDLD
eukprot:COSAG06_NODE_2656_length_6487_cov_109.872260_10_plen_92_part_00